LRLPPLNARLAHSRLRVAAVPSPTAMHHLSCGLDSRSMLPPARTTWGQEARGQPHELPLRSHHTCSWFPHLYRRARASIHAGRLASLPLHHHLSRLGLLQAPPTRPDRKSQTLPRCDASSLQTNATSKASSSTTATPTFFVVAS
jgi:hypothetical protein